MTSRSEPSSVRPESSVSPMRISLSAVVLAASHLTPCLASADAISTVGRSPAFFRLLLRIDPDDSHVVGRFKQRQRVEHGSGCLAAAVPSDSDALAEAREASGPWHDQHGTAVFDRQPLRDIEQMREVETSVALTGHDEIRSTAIEVSATP